MLGLAEMQIYRQHCSKSEKSEKVTAADMYVIDQDKH